MVDGWPKQAERRLEREGAMVLRRIAAVNKQDHQGPLFGPSALGCGRGQLTPFSDGRGCDTSPSLSLSPGVAYVNVLININVPTPSGASFLVH